MCQCETTNTRIKTTMEAYGSLLTMYETEMQRKQALEKELEVLQDEVNLVRWKTQQNIASERTEDGKIRYTNQEQRDIALELELRQNEGFQQLKASFAAKKADLDNNKVQLDIIPRRIRQKEYELKAIELWRN